MSNINILIVDDDFKKIASVIKTIREAYDRVLNISQASCVQEAIEALRTKHFHLLITDLQMPLKYGELPDNNGGQSLIRSLYKNSSKANVPMYIVGLTQYIELQNAYKGVWKVWKYDPSLEEWKISLRDLVFHISLVKSRIDDPKIETIFVEGFIDHKLIDHALKLFYPAVRPLVFIASISVNGGATWVERQLFIWAKSLTQGMQGDYVKSVGVFDNDEAGNSAIDRIRKAIESSSAESKTFSIVKTSYKHSILLKSIKAKGISFPTTIEELIGIECWKEAEKLGWLQARSYDNFIIEKSLCSITHNEINSENLISKGFTEEEAFLLSFKVKDEFKKNFAQLVCESTNNENFESLKFLLMDILIKLKLIVNEG